MIRITLLALALSIPSVSAAGYFETRGDWNNWDDRPNYKAAYVMGVLDRSLALFIDNGEPDTKAILRQSDCLADLSLSPRDLVQLVDEAYTDIEKWKWPPHSVIQSVVFDLCG